MRIDVPQHRFSIETSDEWVPDELDPEALHGLYLRSVAFGMYMNVRAQNPGEHPLTDQGLRALLGEQGWASAPFDEWTDHVGALTIVGGTFETEGMNGEVVLDDITGSAVVNTMNGEVRATYAKAPTKLVSITSMNGEVDLRLPAETKANVRLRTHNGSILTDFDEKVLKTTSEIRGSDYGEGGPNAARLGADVARLGAEAARIANEAVHSAMEVAHEAKENAERAAREMEQDREHADKVAAEAEAEHAEKEAAEAAADRGPGHNPHIPPHAPRPPQAPRAPFPPITGGKLVSGTLNGGGVDIKISTMNGEITLRQSK